MDYLNDVEKAAVEQFYNFETMREAVKKVILASVYENGTLKEGVEAIPTRNAAFSLVSAKPETPNEQLGADLRAMWEGVRLVENAFNHLATYKTKVEPEKPKVNKAR